MPLIFSSLERIEVISNAMELRGFGKKKKRTWYHATAFLTGRLYYNQYRCGFINSITRFTKGECMYSVFAFYHYERVTYCLTLTKDFLGLSFIHFVFSMFHIFDMFNEKKRRFSYELEGYVLQ
ncbi:ABC-type cobalt transport system, permease component CbiQ [Oceanobacillus picturae]|uniref:ABC-type cobalt transport system, permease component CbiQ n=1 Tax=Oceanobacillus picturae TaxID=171693 RepID=W9AJH5_9BACI|nr:ABC-type cobalt transport system, permease component CbiQ [Oceanobacillus picturae]